MGHVSGLKRSPGSGTLLRRMHAFDSSRPGDMFSYALPETFPGVYKLYSSQTSLSLEDSID